MPRLKNRPPSYRLHRASGQAIVTLSGQDHYLGTHGTAASRDAYEKLLGEWLQRGKATERDVADGEATVNVMLLGYLRHAEREYANASSNGHVECIRLMMRPMKRLYGDTPAVKFGPLALQTVRDAYIELGWSRKFVNAQVVRLRGMFKWAVARELVPPTVWAALKLVDGLRAGKSAAPESKKVVSVPIPDVVATLPHVSATIGAMIRIQLLTGARPGETVIMRGCDIDRTSTPWMYSPHQHKNQHRGQDRTIPLGPRAQAIITQFQTADLQAYLFSPAVADASRRAKAHADRKTPLSCGNRPGSNVRKHARWAPGEAYDVGAYYTAIVRGCHAAFPPPPHLHRLHVAGRRGTNCRRWESVTEWKARLGEKRWAELQAWRADHAWHPNQLRHTAATEIRREFGLEAAQVILGHATLSVTEIYAEKNVARAKEIMAEVG